MSRIGAELDNHNWFKPYYCLTVLQFVKNIIFAVCRRFFFLHASLLNCLAITITLFSPIYFIHWRCSYFNYNLVFRGRGGDGMCCVSTEPCVPSTASFLCVSLFPFFYLSHGLCSYFTYTLVFRGQGVDGMSCVFFGNTSAFSVSLYLPPSSIEPWALLLL